VADATPGAARTARLADALLDLFVVGFAAWTVVYHVCVALRIGVPWAAAAWILALALSARFALASQKSRWPRTALWPAPRRRGPASAASAAR
jgi:hypothetical protein